MKKWLGKMEQQIKQLTSASLCAKEIRKILKENFPKIKFSVRSSNFSMGDSVHVSWTNGPTDKKVNELIGHFQYGHFDGMTDMYEYSNSREDIPQTKFLSCDRNYSEEIVRKYSEKYKKEWGLNEPTEDLGYSFEHNGEFRNWHQIAWRELMEIDLTGELKCK